VTFDERHGGRFEALDGTAIVIRNGSDSTLPYSSLPTPSLRETVYGVADATVLDEIRKNLEVDRVVTEDINGVIHTVDDGGFAIAFEVTKRRKIEARYLGFNVPGQTPGRQANDCAANLDEVIKPRSLSHVVYFVSDVLKAEAFYRRIGFVVTDRFNNVGPFLRPAGTQDHHTLFMIEGHHPNMVGCNHFTFHLGSASEVLQHGWNFMGKGYKSFWGPGRHVLGSNFFWYFNSPFGAVMEVDADMDIHDEQWVAREVDPGADNSQIFLFDFKNKWAPGG
jgi:catechol 2,3-dioxygenase-like lactoylglutathione lyase family enzyme